jgi:LAO/AO transport system kinase
VLGKERQMRSRLRPSFPDGLFSGARRPRLITVSGAIKDIGKSSLAAYLAAHCRSCAGMKVSIHAERPPGEVVLEETDPASSPATDTSRLLAAGARPVLWVRSTRESLAEDLREAFSHLEAPVVIVEGNSVLQHLEPDFSVFVMGPTFEGFKPSAFDAIRKAHTVVVNGEGALPGGMMLELERRVKELNPRAKLVAVSELGRDGAWEIVLSRAVGRLGGEHMSAEAEERVIEAVKEKAEDGRIPCAVALELAEELEVPALEVGKAANALGVKIVKCSLGCF